MFDWKALDNKARIPMVFYGRVSTEHEAQLEALENQIQWYYDQLQKNPNWELVEPVETYLDRGITGTQAKKRPGFLSMIEDAKKGKFKMIVTREVCRFARNTVDTLNYVRELKSLGIQVYFVFDNIKTIQDHDGEFRLTIMATNAQEESRRISERAKAGQYIARNNGVLYGNGNILGYDRIRKRSDPDKRNAIGDRKVPTFAIVPEQAETVRMIFNLYAEGYGLRRIKNQLELLGRKNSKGEVKWFDSTITKVLENPMYIGKQYQGKTTVTDYLTHKIRHNAKEDYVLVEGDFEPIISEELFYKVQSMKKNKSTKDAFGRAYGYKASTDKWIQRLECGCGSGFQRYKWRVNKTTGEEVLGYTCRHRVVDGSAEFRKKKGLPIEDACSMPSMPAWKFDFMAMQIFSVLWGDRQDCILDVYKFIAENYQVDISSQESRGDSLKKEIERYKHKSQALIDLYTDGSITLEQFKEKQGEFKSRLCSLENELKELEPKLKSSDQVTQENLEKIKETLNRLVDYDSEHASDELVANFVDKIVMKTECDVDWYINLKGDAQQFRDAQSSNRKNEPYEIRRDRTNRVQKEYYIKAFTICLGFDEAKAFKQKFGKFIRANQWKDLNLTIFIRK